MPVSFFPLSGSSTLSTVLIYPGVGYGTQSFVEDRILNGVLKGVDAPVLVAVAPTASTPYAQVKQEIETFAADTGTTLKPSVLLGWSGGAQGVSAANQEGHAYPSIMLADPSPIVGAASDSRAQMWYQPGNWTGVNAPLAEQQRTLAGTMGNRATLVENTHNEILDLVVEKAVKKSGKAWVVLVTVSALAFLLWRNVCA